LVSDQLVAKGFHVFLPRLQGWSRRAGQQTRSSTPMFSGYLFLRHAMDKTSYLEVRRARGLVRILGERWDRLGIVSNAEIDAIERVLRSREAVLPCPYLKEGQRVRITCGPLQGTEGILLRTRLPKGVLILSIDLLQRSVMVEVDCSVVAAA
jgi:transcription antitermination factor NusG